MTWHRTVSGKIVILLAMIFAFTTFDKISKVNSGEKPCLCSYDGYGYYSYLPHFYEKGNLKFEQEWMQKLQNQYCFGNYAYQLERKDLKADINIYHMGLSFVLLPSYAISDVIARASGYPADGFSKPYHIGYQLNALLFIFLGLLYLRKLLRLFADELSTTVVLILVALGTNAYFIFNFQYDLPHLYLFTINAAAFYHLIRYIKDGRKRSFWFTALLFGLAVCVRPTQLLFGIIPFLLLLKEFGKTKKFIQHILILGGAVLVINIPQFLYWKLVGGEWLILNLHTEDMVLGDPNLYNFLFSYRKGWLLYTPLFVVLPLGFWLMYRKNRMLFWAILSFSSLYIYAMSAWECWWYASSFGQRVMVDVYPILAIPLVFIVQFVRSRIALMGLGIFAALSLILNLFQSEQVQLGIIHGDRMSKEHYWLVFGELHPEKIHHRYLLIDRGNIYWPEHLSQYDDLPFSIKKRTVHQRTEPAISEAGEAVSLGKIHLYNTFQTDETRIEVPMVFTTSDSTQSAAIRMECVSEYNCYSWDNMELSLERRQGIDNYDTLRFNLPNIRHDADSMQMYILNFGSARVELKEFKIEATSLFRK